MQDFSHIDTWVFDLDNTLYDAEKQVFDLVATRMTDFVASFLKVDTVEAARLRKHYYKTYGTTLRGLMTEHALDPGDFLTYVHDIDYSMIDPCAITQAGLSRLAGRKVVFTNAPKHFALRMIDHLGIAGHFDGVFAIEDAGYWPKPQMDTYHTFLYRHGVNPKTACMFEDMEVNLKPAHELGMTTVWFHGPDQDLPAENGHIHHRAEKLTTWFEQKFNK